MYKKCGKRLLDILLSGIGILVLSPLYLILAVAIKLDDPGPVFFRQKRVGIHKTYFEILKFRTMKCSTPHDMPTHMLKNPEQYITRVGRVLRKTSLDELPQIFQIFTGKMSIIGPRPALWNQFDLIEAREQYGANDVRPGLTGWAQINGRDELPIDVKAKLDGEYVEKLSFSFDCRCFFGTIRSVLRHDGVVEGGTGSMEEAAKAAESGKKKILVVCQYYPPEPFRVGDLCRGLVQRGHEVMVLTGYPNYPEGKLYDGYGRGKHTDEVVDGVRIYRCYTVPRGSSAIKRLLNYYSFAWSSTRYVRSGRCLAADGKPFDVVLCNQLSPVLMARAAAVYGKKYRIPKVLYCLDLWPDSLVAGGVSRASFLYRWFLRESRKLYSQMDHILLASDAFREPFTSELDIPMNKLEYLPQYAEALFVPGWTEKDDSSCTLGFAGNLGEVQSVETILTAARLLEDEPIRFQIAGGGTNQARLEQLGRDLPNVRFCGRMDVAQMPEFYRQCDAMLVTLKRDPILSLTLPGKVQSYMAAGKPVLGAIDGETARVIREADCGECVPAEDAQALAEAIRRFLACRNKRVMGENARRYYEANFTRKSFLDHLEAVLTGK